MPHKLNALDPSLFAVTYVTIIQENHFGPQNQHADLLNRIHQHFRTHDGEIDHDCIRITFTEALKIAINSPIGGPYNNSDLSEVQELINECTHFHNEHLIPDEHPEHTDEHGGAMHPTVPPGPPTVPVPTPTPTPIPGIPYFPALRFLRRAGKAEYRRGRR